VSYCVGAAPPIPPLSFGSILGIIIFSVAFGLVVLGIVYAKCSRRGE
jgi:VIT1/CCC1 family predicted Fe2+/Mn2+ transporter